MPSAKKAARAACTPVCPALFASMMADKLALQAQVAELQAPPVERPAAPEPDGTTEPALTPCHYCMDDKPIETLYPCSNKCSYRMGGSCVFSPANQKVALCSAPTCYQYHYSCPQCQTQVTPIEGSAIGVAPDSRVS